MLFRSRYLARGGGFSDVATGEIEWRHLVVPDAAGVLFVDAGALGSKASDLVDAGSERFDVGVGVRYKTPVGPLRLDLAARPLYPEDEGAQRYYGCGSLPPLRRVSDLLSLFGRGGAFTRTVPAVNVDLSIGEQF